MKVLIHTQYYPPEMGAPQARLHELAMGLMRRGLEVTVLTAMPNYPRGRIYEGYGGWLRKECLDGIQIIRTAIYPTHSPRMLPRLLSYFSFLFSSLIAGIFLVKQVGFVLTESPPLFLGLTGWALSRVKGARWIFNISDLWPESVVELGMIERNGLSYKLGCALEKFLYHKAWVVTCQSRSILQHIQQRFIDVQMYHLSNGVDTSIFQPNGYKSKSTDFQIIYAGLHGLAQGLEQVLWAAKKLSQTDGAVKFTLVGDGPAKQQLVRLANELGLTNIHFLDPLPKEKIPQVIGEADTIIVPLKVQLTGAVPSKIYEAMAMGKPVILIAASEAAEIIHNAQCGIVVPLGDIDGFVSAIRYLQAHPVEREQMGMRGREAAVRKYDRAHIAEQFARFLLNTE